MVAEPEHEVGAVGAHSVHVERIDQDGDLRSGARKSLWLSRRLQGVRCRRAVRSGRRRRRRQGRIVKLPVLDIGDQLLGLDRGLHPVFFVEDVPQRLVDAQRAGQVTFFGARLHGVAARFLVGRIETDDGLCQLPPVRRIEADILEAGLERAQDPVMEVLPLGQQPDAKRRVDIVEPRAGFP